MSMRQKGINPHLTKEEAKRQYEIRQAKREIKNALSTGNRDATVRIDKDSRTSGRVFMSSFLNCRPPSAPFPLPYNVTAAPLRLPKPLLQPGEMLQASAAAVAAPPARIEQPAAVTSVPTNASTNSTALGAAAHTASVSANTVDADRIVHLSTDNDA